MKLPQIEMQIGKNGVTDNFITSLMTAFKKRGNIKIHILKSSGHDKEKVKEIAEDIQGKIGNKFTYRIIGFTISFKKLRK